MLHTVPQSLDRAIIMELAFCSMPDKDMAIVAAPLRVRSRRIIHHYANAHHIYYPGILSDK